MSAFRLRAICLLVVLSPALAQAAWSTDVTENNPVCTVVDDQYWPVTVADAAGGLYVVWADLRSDTFGVYAQHLDADGSRLWATDGVAVCTYASTQDQLVACGDGAGGLIVVWRDTSGSMIDIYAQRLDPAGNRLWLSSGQSVTTSPGEQSYPRVVNDDHGGIVVAWADDRGTDADIYAQRLDAFGAAQWTAGGVAICTAAGSQHEVALVGDTLGGAVVTWVDFRAAPEQVYARRVNSLGSLLWQTNGNLAVPSLGRESSPDIERTSDGGFIVTLLIDVGDWGPYQMWAQRFNAAGAATWEWGVSLGPAVIDDYVGSDLLADADGGVYSAWITCPDGQTDIAAQHLSASGARLWTASSLTVAGAAGDQRDPSLALDATGGVYVTWRDESTGNATGCVRAQRLDSLGNELWPSGGRLVNLGSTLAWPVCIGDDLGGLLVTWADNRAGHSDLYAQRLDDTGYLGAPDPSITSVGDLPNDQGGQVQVAWSSSYLDAMPWHAVASYSIWGRPTADHAARTLPTDQHAALCARLTLPPARLDLLLDDGWVYLAQVPAILAADYACLAPSFGDSSAAGIVWSEYRVIGHGDTAWITWDSAAASGYSVDNLRPGAPLALAGERPVPTEVRLTWQASGHHDDDLAVYRIYRGDTAGFPLDTAHMYAESAATSYLDDDASGTWYYRVTAVDVHGNEGDASSELAMSGAVGVGDLPAALALHASYPNPFNPATTLAFDLPAAAEVHLDVLAVDGARVATLVHGHLPAGRHTTTWRGEDGSGRAVAAGVYVARLTVGQQVQARTLVLVR
ncbi:MAG: FlgD immunoglobulin-like domain containing protein [Candidatus Krumholzibacteriia bacterium]